MWDGELSTGEQLVCALLAHSGWLVPAERMTIRFLPSACQCFRGTWQEAPASFGSNQCEIARLSSSRIVAWPSCYTERPRSKSGLSNHPSCRRKPIAVPPSLGVLRRHKSACATKFENKLCYPYVVTTRIVPMLTFAGDTSCALQHSLV